MSPKQNSVILGFSSSIFKNAFHKQVSVYVWGAGCSVMFGKGYEVALGMTVTYIS